MNAQFEWQFGGWLQALGPALAWSVLAVAALGGFGLIIFLYRQTLRELTPVPRNLLTALRAALLLVLLIVLANPSRVQSPKRADNKPEHRLAVLVDRSASMNAADNRNQTRLANALSLWKRHADDAAKVFDHVDYRRFSTGLEKASGIEDAAQTGTPGAETQLWSSLHEALADSPSSVVCLTDGLDTGERGCFEVLTEAQQRGVPLYFVVAGNRSRPAELLSIRDVKTPSRVLRRSKFTASAIMEISTPTDRDVPAELWSGGRRLGFTMLKARSGWNVVPWSVEVAAGEVGAMPLEFRLGKAGAQEIAASTTQVADHTRVEVLYYQGALQWGYRFLRAALEGDPSFHMTSILNPSLGVHLNIASANQSTLPDLPEDATELKRFQIIVLANVFADQLSARQQQALEDYAKRGGGMLFIAPDGEATARFSGTKLEEMLPVVFDGMKVSPEELAARQFRDTMNSTSASEGGGDELLFQSEGRRQDIPKLLPFTVPPGVADFIKPGNVTPMFCNYARVLRVKTAAQILAVHPDERTPDKTPRVLLARQQFGAGFTAAMATDLLWRWKMSLPNESRAAETFWQQLMLSLAPATGEGLRLVKAGSTAAVNRATSISIAGGAGGGPPEVRAIAADGKQQALTVASSPDGWVALFTPETAGRWQLTASDSAGNHARITLPVGAEQRTIETSNTPADVETMRKLAEATGGALIGRDFVFQKTFTADLDAPEEKFVQPLWNQPWLIGTLLGIYATELITRRWLRLL